ncbi:MAG: SRPBCC domain-containing protein [Pseudomonadales bacterium]
MITENTVASDTVTINAPIQFVWDILVDFRSYEKWNSFCCKVNNEALEIGNAVEMTVDLGNGWQQQTEYVSLIEPPFKIAWAMENKPEDPVHAERFQTLESIDEHSCTYVSLDKFAGPAMADMMQFMATAVEAGFNKCAYDLKAHAEALFTGH